LRQLHRTVGQPVKRCLGRLVLVALSMLAVAAIVSAFVDGWSKAGEDGRTGRALGSQLGFQVSGEDVQHLRKDLTGDEMKEGCTTGGQVTFWLIWIGGTLALGRRWRRRSTREPSGPAA
jgi:hypothetical protein